MPIYEYRCGECGVVFEALTKAGRADMICPCDKKSIGYRIMSAPASKFPGTPTPVHTTPPRSEDAGFKREWDSIFTEKSDGADA